MFTSTNPATGQVEHRYQADDAAQVDAVLAAAEQGFARWRDVSFDRRGRLMQGVARKLRDQRDALAELMTREMGKPISQSRAEVEKCAWVCEYYAEHAEAMLAPREIETDAQKSFVRYDPLGCVLAIMPWNFPLWQVFRFAAPSLMAGNVAVLKHASNVPGCARAIERLFAEADFPPGVFSTLLVGSDQIESIIARAEIRAVTLTGSVGAGRAVASAAGKHLKKCVLELGGSDPFIVLEDADPKAAAELAVKSRTINAGQSCIAAKRFLVVETVAEAFERHFIDAMNALHIGDPLDEATDVGPLAREDLSDDLDRQVRASVEAGAKLRLGGRRLDRKGYYYAPTVLTEVTPDMACFSEETFGPLAPIVRVADENAAIRLANRSEFGLGACVVTTELERAAHLAAEIDSGCVFVNQLVKSDPRVPFGGVKHSGYGRELSDVGIREFVNIKTVWIEQAVKSNELSAADRQE